MIKNYLDGEWKLYYFEQGAANITDVRQLTEQPSIPCKVPGNAELDLSAAGILPKELWYGDNTLQAEQYETYEWWYEKEFSLNAVNEDLFIVFEGVACVATYYLNGEKIGFSRNMLIPVTLPLRNAKKGKNVLHVHIASTLLYEAEEEAQAISSFIGWRKDAVSPYARIAPHMHGWDIMPRALSAGIWRSVYYYEQPKNCFKQLFYHLLPYTKTPTVRFFFDMHIENACMKKRLELEIRGTCGNSVFYARERVRYKFGYINAPVENIRLWWPKNYGEPNQYDTAVTLYADGQPIATETLRAGLRTIRFDTTEITDGKDGRYQLYINEIPILCMGTNWVPIDPYHSRDREKYEVLLPIAEDIGCNMMRCWGGGVYEDHAFFDWCDAHGIMIWQDFSLASHSYPQNETFYTIMREEAETVVKRLRNHPSIVVWSGDNECDQLFDYFETDPNDNVVTRQVFAEAIRTNDYGRPYIPSSPLISRNLFRMRDYSRIPEDHLWGTREYYKNDYFKNSKAHFVSETGWLGCPCRETLEQYLDAAHLWPKYNDWWVLHTCDQEENDHIIKRLDLEVQEVFGEVPADLDTFIFASQAVQAEAFKYFIERIRYGKPEKSGILWWSLFDGWPQTSNGILDYFLRKKMAYTYIQRAQAPFIIMAKEVKGLMQEIVAANDCSDCAIGSFTVSDGETDEILLQGDFNVEAGANADLGSIAALHYQQRLLIMHWTVNGRRGMNHYLAGYPPFSIEQYRRFTEILQKNCY